ncbi:hypothetical protein TNCV_1942481 [Trichonephila clavipes]|nr:hypothetical protein TNCV_1942481 [Trichonephila clavipes]
MPNSSKGSVSRKSLKTSDLTSNSEAQHPMRARAYCAHPSISHHWALRCMSRCPDQTVSMKRDPYWLSPQ